MTDITIQQIMENMPQAFMPERAGNLTAVIQLHLSGDGGGDWMISIADGKCATQQGLATNPRLTLRATAQDYLNIALGKLDGTAAFMQGKLKMQGDLNLAMKMLSFFKR